MFDQRVRCCGPVMLMALLGSLGGCGDSSDEAAAGAGGSSATGGSGGSGGVTHGSKPNQGPPQNPVGGFTIQLPELTLARGEEVTPCYLLDLNLEGPSGWVAASVLETTEGLHHGNVTTRPISGEGLRDCEAMSGLVANEAGDILAGGQVLFGSTTQFVGKEWRKFPEGMAYQVKDGFEVVARMHYLNTTTEPLTVAPSYEFYTIAEADVVTPIGPFFWQIADFEIPARSEYRIDTDCYQYKPMNIVDAMPHMHALGTEFSARYLGGERDGEAFIDQPFFDADTAIRQFVPAVDIGQGEGLSFNCVWDNTFDRPIVEGIGDNEMCMLFGYAYPPENAFTLQATSTGHCLAILPPG